MLVRKQSKLIVAQRDGAGMATDGKRKIKKKQQRETTSRIGSRARLSARATLCALCLKRGRHGRVEISAGIRRASSGRVQESALIGLRRAKSHPAVAINRMAGCDFASRSIVFTQLPNVEWAHQKLGSPRLYVFPELVYVTFTDTHRVRTLIANSSRRAYACDFCFLSIPSTFVLRRVLQSKKNECYSFFLDLLFVRVYYSLELSVRERERTRKYIMGIRGAQEVPLRGLVLHWCVGKSRLRRYFGRSSEGSGLSCLTFKARARKAQPAKFSNKISNK